MTLRYNPPNRASLMVSAVIRRLAEAGVSIAGTRALRIRGRTTGTMRSVVVNVLDVDGREYLVSLRGNTEWARNARAAGEIEMGPRWRRRTARLTEVADPDKTVLLRRYLQRWYWEVKGHAGGLTPRSGEDEIRAAAPSIPVFELLD